MAAPKQANTANNGFEDLLTAIGQRRDRDAFIRLFHYFAPRIKSFLMKGGMAPDQAEETAQDAMLTVWARAATFDPARASASTWIFTIARNKRIDALRKTARAPIDDSDPVEIPDATVPADRRMMDRERIAGVAAALKTLPPEQAAIIEKAFFEGKTHAQIAQESGLKLGTVKSRIRLAFDRLRPQLKQERMI